MICIIALVVFGIMGIFSASHRQLAKEAFSCVFRRITLRKCETSFDQKMKMKISTKLLKRSPTAGKFVFRHFEAISWAMTLLLVVSLVFSVWGLYNFFAFGNCNGEFAEDGTCIYSDIAKGLGGVSCGSEKCAANGCDCDAKGCDAPDFIACEGDCDCQKGVCEGAP